MARANLIFGLHVHVGIEDRELAIHIMNAGALLPAAHLRAVHQLALLAGAATPASSPTAARSSTASRAPASRTTSSSRGEYDNYIKLLIKTGCIDNGKKIWWDIRPHPFFDTLEFRICDVPMRVDETIALAALSRRSPSSSTKLIKQNLGFRLYRRLLINENKWRAARYGISGKLIDFGKQEEVDTVAT